MRFAKILAALSLAMFWMACAPKEKIRYEYVDSSGEKAKVPDQPSDLNPGPCSPQLTLLCDEIQVKISAAQKTLQDALQKEDWPAFYLGQADLNELLEIRNSYQNGEEDVTAITQRYQALKAIISANGNNEKTMQALAYHPEELAAVREVFAAFGELTLDPQTIGAADSSKPPTTILSAADAGIPWAGYWYPKRGKELFAGPSSPLRKLDDDLQKNNLPSGIAQWEADHFDPSAAEWEGMCDAWAMASVSLLEPKKPLQVDGITFSVSDLKALSIKYYENYQPQIFGRRYLGVAATDGLIQDIRPEAFHRIIEEYIGKRQRPIIVDEDPGPEIWSKPIFRMAFSMQQDPEVVHSILVKAYP